MNDFARVPPHDIAAEQIVVGAMMMSRDAIADVIEVMRPSDHYRPAHQIIHETVLRQYDHGNPCDAVAVAAELAKTGDIGKVGGPPYLHTLLASVPVAANAGYYARLVREKATLRGLVEVGTRITQYGYQGGDDPDLLVERARLDVDGIAFAGADAPPPLPTILTDAIDGLERDAPTGLATPWDDVNRLLSLNGFVVIAARPSVGKSDLGLNIATHAAVKLGVQSVVFSLEMDRNDLTLRLLSSEGRVPLDHLVHRHMSEQDWDRVAKATKWLMDAPLVIDDYAGANLAYIRSRLNTLNRVAPVGLVVVDYLQLMPGAGKSENRQQDVAALSRGLKLISREYGIPVVALAQLNRSPEQRGDKRPMLSDLRDSGQIEADADQVWLLHRDELYDRTERPGEIDVIIAKHRQGRTDTVTLAFQGHYSRAADMWSPSHTVAA